LPPGTATLVELTLAVDLGIDELVMPDLSARLAGTIRPGCGNPASAFNFVLAGTALAVLDGRTRRAWFPAQWLALVIALAPAQVLIAYSHGVNALLQVGPYPQLTQMAPHTALAWIALSLGILAARPEHGFMAALSSGTQSAKALRRILPVAVLAPTLLAWVTMGAEKWKIYHPGFGASFFALLITISLVALVWSAYAKQVRFEKQLSEALESRDVFISIASHELNTPLTALKLQLQMAARHPESSAQRLASSMQQVERVTSLIDDMLDVSRIRTGQMAFNYAPVNLTELTRTVLARHAESLSVARVQVDAQLEEGLSAVCDGTRIDQVLTNLISNAIKYAPGAALRVEAASKEDSVQWRIRDSGPGIPIDRQSVIFDRFERGATHAGSPGLGLGLYICRKIVEAHRGSIRVESQPGRGAAFVMDIPQRPNPDT
jgi:signal transduction histidine kinase